MKKKAGWLVMGALGLALAGACGDSGEGTAGSSSGFGASGAGGGGTGGSGASAGCLAGLESIELSPADSTVQLDGIYAAPIPFNATAVFSGGDSQSLEPATLTWAVSRADDTPPGTIDAGVLEPYRHAGGVVTVTASDGCITGETTVTFFVDATLGQPDNPSDWTGTPEAGAGAPSLVYPSDRTRFPRNLYRTLFQWRTEGTTEFRLVFTGTHSVVTVYTDGAHGLCDAANPAAGCWEVDEVTWNLIAGSNAGSTAEWVVDGLDTSTNPPTIRRSEPVELGFSLQDVEGAIFYWSTTSAGIRRGRISQQDPEDYVVGKPAGTVYGDDEIGCVACHVVSRDGQYMAAPTKSAQTGSLWIWEVTESVPPNPLVTDIPDTGGHGFATISPDDAHVVVSFKQDFMWMVNRATGAFEAELPTQAFDGGTHPDWSPDDTQLVFSSGNGDGPDGASLALIPWDGNAWGQPSELLPPVNDESNLFPMFDHDGEWIAFVVGKGGHGDNTAQLWLLDASGGQPIELVAANRVTSNAMTDGQYQNSQPTWAPPGDLDWVAFNSKREYGVVLDEGTQQIWVAAVDLSKAESGEDASYPAFRVPFQGLDEDNHRAYWTLDIGDGGGGAGGGGGGGGSAPCAEILGVGETCSSIDDCCESGTYCDSQDNGETYQCVVDAPN